MKEYILNGNKYKIEKSNGDIFDYEIMKELVTDYFDIYDYILVDEAYNKFRLKGFCDKNNSNLRPNNNIKILDDYIKNYCAYKCKWFLLKKVRIITLLDYLSCLPSCILLLISNASLSY